MVDGEAVACSAGALISTISSQLSALSLVAATANWVVRATQFAVAVTNHSVVSWLPDTSVQDSWAVVYIQTVTCVVASYVRVSLSAHISQEPFVRISPNFTHVAFDGIAIHYVLPVLRMTP